MTQIAHERPLAAPLRGPAAAHTPRSAGRRPWVAQAAVLLGALAAWELLDRSGIVSDDALAPPAATFARLGELLVTAEVWTAVGQTLTGWGIGIAIAIALAVPLGIGLGLSNFAYRSTRLVVDFLRTIPALGLIPLAALVFGASRSAVLVVVVPACVWPLLLQTAYGVRDADPLALETARSFRLGTWGTLRRVVLPGALPFVATGLRLSAILGMLLAMSIEMLILVPGVGALLGTAQRNGDTVDVYALTLLAAFLGLAVALAVSRLERRMIRWHPSVRSRR
ncbi:ABC transporter permease subunit [Streptomyces sp. YC504]|uniref:ABC transporter permease subunit n=1 Tax=Streptomyces mesophilus TaxID=1775132 RepID=A0A6G4XSG9_9ACTN|nr:ABC transporter permease subunit [Streptomyces mesophilus]NGO80388.1 ABC transporter permease subunit [Streptomyces mesophilus]